MKAEQELWYTHPATGWTEALPLGNGTIGAMVYGDPEQEKILLNHENLWSGYPKEYKNKEAFSTLDSVRNLIRNDENKRAQILMEERMAGSFNESFLPMASVKINNLKKENCIEEGKRRAFKRYLNLCTAQTGWKLIDEKGSKKTARCFISHPDQILVYSMEGENLNYQVSLESQLMYETEPIQNGLLLTGKAPSHVAPHYWECNNAIQYSEQSTEQGMLFGVSLIWDVSGGNVCYKNKMVKIIGAVKITLYISAVTSFNGIGKPQNKEFSDKLVKNSKKACDKGIEKIYFSHLKEYQKMYMRNELFLGEGEEENYPTDIRIKRLREGKRDIGLAALQYHYGRYLLLASSRHCQEPANLQGIWNKELRPYWSCNYTTNINLEMNYWAAEECNLSECSKPLIKLISEISIDGKKTAKEYYGCGGWTVHHNVDLWRKAIPAGNEGKPVYGMGTAVFWNMAGAWLCRHLWEHYLYTGDKKFLNVTGRPLIEGAVDFLLDWVVKAADGRYTTEPSSSPENSFYTKNGEICSIASGSAMDLEIITDLLHIYESMIAELQITKDLVRGNRVKEVIQNLKQLSVDNEGKINEWDKERPAFEKGHRHQSPLYGIYPASCIAKESKEYEACRKFLNWKVKNKSSEFGWSLAWTLNLYSRFQDRSMFQKELNKFLKGSIYPNLFTLHPPLSEKEREVFQIDAGFGYTAAIAECLLQSHNNRINILPCLPPDWTNGEIKGIKARGGHELDIAWKDGQLYRVGLLTGFQKNVNLEYGDRQITIYAEIGKKYIFDGNLNKVKGQGY